MKQRKNNKFKEALPLNKFSSHIGEKLVIYLFEGLFVMGFSLEYKPGKRYDIIS
jgi:hypothetical protein